ncbi:RHS repeat domain-containing protein [Sorangium sp. So ce693]|uniref:RHS repeat domain-containing protein n=1 Tax=Sorangium sp. So ce693 TaxID=3133318 RepID=UPI003F633713
MQLGSGGERLARRYVHGEAHPQATALNLRGGPYHVYDGAGVVTSQAYDFKGNVLEASRRLRSNVHADADWAVLSALTDVSAIATAAEPLLETESFGTQTAYDALNRRTSLTAPDGLTASDASEIKPTYNEAGLLERVEARIRGAVAWTTFVDNIDYDAKGRRERIDYGNGTSTAYTYDPLTFRLSRLKTTRSSDSAALQNLTYVYDPVGNIVEIGDSAQQTVFFNNAVVSPRAQYVYDAVYRLIEAMGRELSVIIASRVRSVKTPPIVESNWLAGIEREAAVGITPTEFAARATGISLGVSRVALGKSALNFRRPSAKRHSARSWGDSRLSLRNRSSNSLSV